VAVAVAELHPILLMAEEQVQEDIETLMLLKHQVEDRVHNLQELLTPTLFTQLLLDKEVLVD
jgi:hypothetical protein